MNQDWDGKGRRIHDQLCDKKWDTDRKEWVQNQICMATKPGKAKQAMMWTIMVLMLSGSLGGAYVSYSSAQAASDFTEKNTTTHVRNTTDIAHLKDEVEDVKDHHEHLVGTVEEMQRTQGRMDRNLSTLMGAMGVPAEEK